MKKNSLIVVILILTILCLFYVTLQSKPTEKEDSSSKSLSTENKSNPNIILILSDDMGYSDIGSYGSEIETPNLDKMANAGIRFSQFYNTSRCCPTRASLLTGLYPAQTGIGMMTNDEGVKGYRGDLNQESLTIAEVLKNNGYNTYMSGKWHVTKEIADVDSLKYNWPLQRGFHKFYGTITGAGSFWDPYTLTRNNSFISSQNDSLYQPDTYYYTDAISDNAVTFIEENDTNSKNTPFFMYVAYTAAHWPLHAPEDEIAKYKGKYDEGFDATRQKRFEKLKSMGLLTEGLQLPETIADWDTVPNKSWHARNMEVYAAMITRMDKGIGKILKKLETKGIIDNTLIIFLQDNGACAEELEWLNNKEHPKTLSVRPVHQAMSKDELQNQMVPTQNRSGYPVVLQNETVMSGSDQTYNAYGPTWANVSNTPFKQFKHWVHEGGISTPLIVQWPQVIKDKGQIRHQPSHIIDIMATCIDISNANYPTVYNGNSIQPLEGISLRSLMVNNETTEREAIFFEHEGNRAIRQNKWKLVSVIGNDAESFAKINKLPLEQWSLFDMETDRTETNDLASQHPEIVQELSEKWFVWAKRTNTVPKPND